MTGRRHVARFAAALALASFACDGYRAYYRLNVDYIEGDADAGYFRCGTWYRAVSGRSDAGLELFAGPPGNPPTPTHRVAAACPEPWLDGQVEYVRITPDGDGGVTEVCRLCADDWSDVAKVEGCVLRTVDGCP